MEVVVAVAGTTIMSTVKAVVAMADITTTMRVRDAAVATMIMKRDVSAAANIITIMRMDAVVAIIMTMMRNITIILINVITITKKRIKPNNNEDQGVKLKLLALFCYEY